MARQATRTRARNTVADVPEYVAPVGDTALTTGTVETPADPETPKAGDNSGEVMIDPKITHAAIEATLFLIRDNENAIEHARQKLAYQLLTRHLYLRATDPTTPDLADMAMNAVLVSNGTKLPNGDRQPAMFAGYLSTLTTEFAGESVAPTKQTTDEMRAAARNRTRMNTRLDRSLRLLCNISWLGQPNVTRWDEETQRWFVPASAFVPHGWHPSGDMLIEPGSNGLKLREGVWLEPTEAQKLSCTIQKLGSNDTPQRITQSLDQLTHAVVSQIEAAHAGKTAEAAAATKAEAAKIAAEKAATEAAAAAQRAPQMPGTRNASTPAASTTPAGDDADDDADAAVSPTGAVDQDNLVKLFNQHVTGLAKIIATGLQMSRERFTPETWNSYVEVIMFGMKIPGMIVTMKQTGAAAQLDKANAAGRGKAA